MTAHPRRRIATLVGAIIALLMAGGAIIVPLASGAARSTPVAAASARAPSPSPATQAPGAGAGVLDGSLGARRPSDPRVLNPLGVPAAVLADDADLSAPDDFCQIGRDDVAVVTCGAGDLGSTRIIALVGDSKIGQWLPALDALGREHGWRIRTYVKSSCPFSAATVRWRDQPYPQCRAWAKAVLARLTGPERPQLVLTSAVRGAAYGPDGVEHESDLVAGYAEFWRRMAKAGVRVVALADTPQPPVGRDIRSCLAGHPTDFMTRCSYAYGPGLGTPALKAATDLVPDSRWLDLSTKICPAGACWPVIGDTVVYRQGSHLSKSYAASLAAPLWRGLARLAPETITAG